MGAVLIAGYDDPSWPASEGAPANPNVDRMGRQPDAPVTIR